MTDDARQHWGVRLSMPMGVVHIGKVRMLVSHPIVTVTVRVWLARRIVWTVDVLVVRIVHM